MCTHVYHTLDTDVCMYPLYRDTLLTHGLYTHLGQHDN